MNVAVIGSGYVGLVTGTCLAEKGNDVTCVDIDTKKVAAMRKGKVPIFEPGLDLLFERNIKENRLHFTTDLADVTAAEVVFLALPTPPGENGSADLSYVLGAATDLGKILKDYTVIVDKSTVPVGTAALVHEHVAKTTDVAFDVVSNPEFLREGQAIDDFMHPDRIIIGTSSERAAKVMHQLYRHFVLKDIDRIHVTDEPTAELIKYAANAFLATKISFINQLSGFAEAVGADIGAVRQGMGSDRRIGLDFLWAGPGYGGSCFPKDTLALLHMAEARDIDLGIVRSTVDANEAQKRVIPQKILDYYNGDIKGKRFALWGLAFKDKTDDIRESPALVMAQALLEQGADVVAFDPQAMPNVKQAMPADAGLQYAKDEYEALQGADALVVATNWDEFSTPDFAKVKSALREPVIFDGRNMYELDYMQELGFRYASIGRRLVDGR